MKSSQKPISIYIHWPYCLSKCPYCDFASSACTHIDEEALWPGYQRDIETWVKNRPIASIFFGGGTPSLMSVSFLNRFLDSLLKKASFLPDCEITMEANPDAIDKSKMQDFHRIGVNRLSLGVQALNEADLKFLGRRHSVETAYNRISKAQSVFDNINIDLIYARPNQTKKQWEAELQEALSLDLPHYSLYQLTIEENTPFFKKKICPASEDVAVQLYCLTDDMMASAKRPAYEVSNYALSGFECRHNLTYWLGKDYIGIGPAAHGRIGQAATQNPRKVRDWLAKGATIDLLTREERQTERLLMGLRLRQHWFPKTGLSTTAIQKFVRQGLLSETKTAIRPTLKGTLVLDRLILELMP